MSLLVGEYIRSLHTILESGDIASDTYNHALSINVLIERLYKQDVISNKELLILNEVASGYSYAEIGSDIELDRKSVSKIFRRTCRKIGYILGGKFTDIGFAHDVASKHAFGHKELEQLDKFLQRQE